MTAPRPPVRTQHRNLVTGADLSGSTAHRESRVDVEDYLEPITAARTQALHGPGVAAGLRVTATANVAGLRVAVGVAVDRGGRTVALQDGGVAVTARGADATTARNVPTVAVAATGVALDTAGLTGDHLLTLAWAEAEAGGATQLRHAPWLQLLPAGDPNTAPDAVVLAQVTFGPGGVVTALAAGDRTAATGHLRLRALRQAPAPDLAVDHTDAAALRGRPDGGLDVVPAGAGAALSIDGAGGVAVPGDLTVAGDLRVSAITSNGGVEIEGALTVGGALVADGLRAGTVSAGSLTTSALRSPDVIAAHTFDAGSGTDIERLRIAGESTVARVTIGPGANGRLWTRHIDGKHHAQDTNDGLFLNWDTGQPVHVGGGARADLRVSGDALIGAGGVGTLTIRHVNGKSHLNDGPDGLFLNWNTGQAVHVGGAAAAELAVHGHGRVDANLGSAGKDPVAGLPSGWGGGVHTWDVFAEGSVGCGPAGVDGGAVPAGLDSTGAVWGRSLRISGAKKFVIDHPLDPERRLVHACVEGPEAAVYYRGEGRLVDGTARVALPAYFEALVREERRTVQLTAVADPDEPVAVLATTPVVGGGFTVRAADGSNPRQRFCWQVTGVRADVEPLEVEIARRPAAVTEAMAHA